MDFCHLKNAESEPKFEKYKGRVVLRGDSVQDDSGAYAVFTEQGSSASQLTAAKVMDVIARVPDCDGQADAVSASTHVKMEDAPRLLRIPKSECQYMWIRLPRHKWPKWANIEDPVDIHLLVSCGKDSSRKFMMERGSWKVPNWECLFVHRKQGLFFSVYVDDKKWLERSRLWLPCGRNSWKNVDLDEPTSLPGLHSTRMYFLMNTENEKFESRNSAGSTCSKMRWEILRSGEQKDSSSTKSLVFASMTTIAKKRNLNQLENCPMSVLKLSCNVCIQLELVGLTFVGQWTNLLDQQPNGQVLVTDVLRLISHIHHTSDYRQHCHVGNTAQHCRLGFFQDSDFAGNLEDSKSTLGGFLWKFGSRTFVTTSWMCKKQSSVSHSSTESEIILDAGLRMDGLPALDLWDVVIEVLRSSKSTESPTHQGAGNCSRNHKSNGVIFFVCWTSCISRCFSCGHFLSNRKQSVMSKRAQESTSKEGSAVAKPRPMNLVSRNLLSAKKTPPQDSSASNSPVNQELDQSYVSPIVRKLMRNSNQDPTAHSQERRQDDTPSSSTRKLMRSGESVSSASTRKLERGDDIQSEGQGWNSSKNKSQTVDTLRKSSRTFGRSWI